MNQLDADRLMNRVVGQLDYNNYDKAQVVIEAVFEDLSIKHKVIKECEAEMSPDSIFASNICSTDNGNC